MKNKSILLTEKIKAGILDFLAYGKAKFSDIRDNVGLMDNGQLNYHLKQLVKEGLILNKKTKYGLTGLGKKLSVYSKQFNLKEMYPISVVCPVVMNKKGELLLLKRAKEPERGRWNFPGGKISFGEKVKFAAERELFEETGLKIKARELRGIISEQINKGKEKILHVNLFIVMMKNYNSNKEIKLSSTNSEFGFFSIQRSKKLKLISNNRKVIKNLKRNKLFFIED